MPIKWSSEELLDGCPEKQWIQDEHMKYVTGSFDDGNGLGNKMYQIASLYGIARTIGRLPYFDANSQKLQANLAEWAEAFPNLMCILRVVAPKHVKQVDFATGLGNYDDPSRLQYVAAKYTRLSATYLQSYKYFDAYRRGVLHLFEFGDSVKREVESYVAHRLPNLESRHKMCVHVRRDDFIGHRMLESKKENVEALVAYALQHVEKVQEERNITIILLGTDDIFPKSLNFATLTPEDDVYIHRALRRASDLYFASRICDSFVMTASGSTFAWWMAYLNGRATVFYNAQLTDDPDEMNTIADYDMFPEKWIRLVVRNETAQRQSGWWGQ